MIFPIPKQAFYYFGFYEGDDYHVPVKFVKGKVSLFQRDEAKAYYSLRNVPANLKPFVDEPFCDFVEIVEGYGICDHTGKWHVYDDEKEARAMIEEINK